MARLSAEYELFVNASYMSRVKAQAARNLYLCYFPTPFDHDLAGWQRRLVRLLGRHVRQARPGVVEWGLGWFPPEGGRRRSWVWTSGRAGLQLAGGPAKRVVFDLGRPGGPGPAEVVVSHEGGAELARLEASPAAFRRHQLELPPSDARPRGRLRQRHLRARGRRRPHPGGGGEPAAHGRRHLGAAALGRRALPLAAARPHRPGVPRLTTSGCWPTPSTPGTGSGGSGGSTRTCCSRRSGPGTCTPGAKARRILTVGRFIAPGFGHSKKQLEQVKAFGQMVRGGGLDGWELHLVGGCEPAHRPYLAEVERAAAGLPVSIHANAPRALVEELLATSSVFWAATGLGEDEEAAPWVFEHFGITTVEAMAAGCVPVVIDKAGQREIVRHGTDGYRWTTLAELEALTRTVAGDEPLRARLAASAVERAATFSEEAFATRWREIAAGLGLR